MGWLWSSPSPPPPESSRPPTQPSSTPPKPSPKNDDDDALVQLLSEIRQDISKPKPAKPEPPSTPQSSSTSTLSSWLGSLAAKAKPADQDAPPPATSTSRHPTPETEALAHSLRPTSMSCRQAFDLAYACQSMGGQFRAVYREGSVRSCSHLWDDFWFCMRVKSYSGPVKEEMVREHYRKKELEKYGGKPNSEDVWASREGKVEVGSVFREPFVEEVMSDEQWQLMEIERRKQIRRELGYDS